MKKRWLILFVMVIVLVIILVIILTSFSATQSRYKRINLSPNALDESQDLLIAEYAKVDNRINETYPDRIPVYKITPRKITEEELTYFANHFGIDAPITYGIQNIPMIALEKESSREIDATTIKARFEILHENELYYHITPSSTEEMKQSDETLEAMALEIFEELPLIQDEVEYEFIGQTFAYTVRGESDSYDIRKVYSFHRVLDDVRVVGEDYVDISFDAWGCCGITLKLYDYEKIDEIEMMPLKEAVERVKTPDAFSISTDETAEFTGKAESMQIERVKLLLVNQYSEGCDILQPVYNLMGTATNENGSAEFSAKIIAIPEKYTHD